MNGWRIFFTVSVIMQWIAIWILFGDYHFVDPALYEQVKSKASLDAISVASQIGRFDLASMFLAIVSILLGIGGIVGFIEVRFRTGKLAEETARQMVDEKVSALFDEAMRVKGQSTAVNVGMTEEAVSDVIGKSHELKQG